MKRISVVIITYNESRNIERCIDSVRAIADEIIVLDSFSTDDTVERSRALGAKVIQHIFDGHIEQKNRAWQLASCEWVLSLDADEALDEKLRQSIHKIKSNAIHQGYYFNRLTNYCGKWIRHSGWYPDQKLRLWEKDKGQWGGDNPHDKFEMYGGNSTGFIEGDLLHYSYYTPEEHLEKARKYAQIAAKSLFNKGKKPTFIHLYLSPVAKFVKSYLIKSGWLDGKAGWDIALISALETKWRYRHLRTLWAEQLASR